MRVEETLVPTVRELNRLLRLGKTEKAKALIRAKSTDLLKEVEKAKNEVECTNH